MDTYKLELSNGTITATLNKFAKQTDATAMMAYGDTNVLVTAVAAKEKTDKGFFPLIVNYDEKLYSVGKIPGNFGRREGKPSEQATLTARLIDRPIRPMFPEDYKQEVQVVATVMSLDHDFGPEMLALNGASLALMLAGNIPFEGPVAAVVVGMVDGEFIINPSVEQLAKSDLELKLAGTKTEINMVEAKANELSEEVMVDALMFGHETIQTICKWQEEIVAAENIEQIPFEVEEDEILTKYLEIIKSEYSDQVETALKVKAKHERGDALNVVKTEIVETYITEENEETDAKALTKAFNIIEKDIFRKLIIEDKYRVDGRQIDEIRPLNSEIELLPRVHGSAMFTRGETQVIALTTLGVKSDAPIIDGLEPEIDQERTFMLHYNFPPYSVGECGRMGAPGRREIGHGKLAENALSIVMPSQEEFPYTIRVVAEVLESNGSSSQATVCSTSMSLMQAGVPIKKPVAGIAMGLIADENDYTILTDIQGLEDHLGDMDFKVAGTKDGINAIQMDIKIQGISREVLTESLEQARIGRMQILDNMNATIAEARPEVSEYAPKTITMKIDEKQIKDVIGKGGETINKIIEETGVKIDIEDDGQVFIFGVDPEMIKRAQEIILKITKVYAVGERFEAEVFRIEAYGAFVKFEDQEALMHISDVAKERIEKVEDKLSIGQKVQVEIKEIDNKKRIKVKNIIEE